MWIPRGSLRILWNSGDPPPRTPRGSTGDLPGIPRGSAGDMVIVQGGIPHESSRSGLPQESLEDPLGTRQGSPRTLQRSPADPQGPPLASAGDLLTIPGSSPDPWEDPLGIAKGSPGDRHRILKGSPWFPGYSGRSRGIPRGPPGDCWGVTGAPQHGTKRCRVTCPIREAF